MPVVIGHAPRRSATAEVRSPLSSWCSRAVLVQATTRCLACSGRRLGGGFPIEAAFFSGEIANF